MNLKELTKKIRHLDVVTSHKVTEVFAGNYKSAFKGQGLEVNNVRLYQEGDASRHIDWILTARQGRPYVKEFQESRELTTMILVDLSASMNFGSAGKSKRESAVETAALLIFSALKNNDKFGAVLFTDTVEKYIPPKKGRMHALAILRDIIHHYENNHKQKSNPLPALDFFNKIVKKRSLCFLLSDTIFEENSGSLSLTGQKHDFVYVNLLDPWEKNLTRKGAFCFQDLETGRIREVWLADKKLIQKYNQRRHWKLEKMQTILRKNRIDRLEILTNENVYKKLLLFFKKRQLRY